MNLNSKNASHRGSSFANARSIHQIRGGYRFNGDDILLAREAWHAAPAARNLLDLGVARQLLPTESPA